MKRILDTFRRWLRRWKLRRAYRRAIVGVDLSTTGDMTAIPPLPLVPVEPKQPDGLAVDIETPSSTLCADNRPFLIFRADGIDAFRAQAATCVTDADLIAAYATLKETHYITHGRKARTRKKYRNRVLRRARKKEAAMNNAHPIPDCMNCIHKATCDRAKEGIFCPAFASRQPPARSDHDDPNTAWRAGRDYND